MNSQSQKSCDKFEVSPGGYSKLTILFLDGYQISVWSLNLILLQFDHSISNVTHTHTEHLLFYVCVSISNWNKNIGYVIRLKQKYKLGDEIKSNGSWVDNIKQICKTGPPRKLILSRTLHLC